MQTQNKGMTPDFTGQNIYVGIDTHFKTWMVSIYSDEFELKTFGQEPDVDRLENYLKKHYPNANLKLAYESGFCGFWIQRSFAKKGINCTVIHAADVPGSNKELIRKTDKVDSRKIAKGLKNNDLNYIFIPDEQLESDRQLLRSRIKIVRDTTSVKNRIKAFLKFKGINIPDEYKSNKWSKKFITWLQYIEHNNISSKTAFESYIDELVFLLQKQTQLDKAIKTLADSESYSSNMYLLTTVPAIGLLSAMTLLTELGDISRFQKQDHLYSYCGLTPDCHSSGDMERIGKVSRRGNIFIKTVLIECAWVAVRKDPALLLYYKQQLPKMDQNKAIIKVARKLLNRIRYVLKNKAEYQTGIVE
jgi:transposase